MDTTVSRLSRLPDLDLLRAVAILLVLGRHVLLIPDNLSYGWLLFWRVWNRCGWIGVDLFFTLSGFLVSGLLFREFLETGKVSPTRFLIRRGLKIYPAFYTFLLISVTVSLIVNLYGNSSLRGFSYVFPSPSAMRILSEIFFFQNYAGYLWGHTWSLAVEEHFYIGLAVLVALFVRFRQDSQSTFSYIPKLVIRVGLILLIIRVAVGYGLESHWTRVLPKTHFRIDSLLYGVLLSYYYHIHPDEIVTFFRRYRWWLGTASVAMIAPAFVVTLEDSRFMYTFGFTLLYIAFGNVVMLLRVWTSPVRNALMHRMRWVIALGRHSYSVYLWHLPIYLWVMTLLPEIIGARYFLVEVTIYFSLSLMIGAGMSLLVEQPALHLRDEYFPSKSRALN